MPATPRTVAPRSLRPLCLLLLAGLIAVATARQARAGSDTLDGDELLLSAVNKWADLIEPPAGAPARTLSAKIKMVKTAGLVREAADATGEIAYQAPDRLRVSALVGGQTYAAGRDGQQLWAHEPDKHFALLARSGVQRFKADPASIDNTHLGPFALPISRLQLRVALAMVRSRLAAPEKVAGDDCHVLDLTLLPAAADLLHAQGGQARLWVRQSDLLPMRVTFQDGKGADVQVDVIEPKITEPWPEERWKLVPNEQDQLHTVALSHITKFIEVAPKILRNQIPTLGPATGKRELVATSGKGRLEMIDGTRVLFLMGTPEEMGKQHGKLLNGPIHDVANRILYGVGVGSSFAKGNWFIDEIEGAEARLEPHMDPRYLREMDAIAKACDMHPQEARLANFFPELFHCSGFALMNGATKDGHVYHGRVLDYMRGVGLEQNAVVIVHQPDVGHAWVNISYAGFVGSVTAMNEKGISIGEMGGRGYGNWDGKPMAQLMREVMEKASTLDEAVEIMRKGPRTCEYYYVIADGNAKTAVGIGATPDKFEVVHPGEAHARLPHPVQDTVLVSAGERYDLLAERVRSGWGKFDADSARDLMTRPVCMTSNIHSVLFRPDTLDLWVANADSKNVASATRYTHYNLKELIRTRAPDPGF
jgi:hypothetical protein